MYKHILIPTDGSPLSARAVKAGIALAKSLGARITACHVSAELSAPVYGEGEMFAGLVSKKRLQKESASYAHKLLDAVERQAAAAGVEAQGEHVFSNAPFEAILGTARRRRCDLMVMASHGRRGVSALLLGSETQKVLTHSKIPVLVIR